MTPILKACVYCERPFEPSPQAHRRSVCYDPSCIAMRREDRRAQKAEFDLRTAGPPREPPSMRTCLRCDRRFESRGPENRICIACKSTRDFTEARIDSTPIYW